VRANSVWAVVPVKPFHAAKLRLSPVLDAAERAQLARAMLEDVLGVLEAAGNVLAGVIVLTADEEAAAIARAHGAVVLAETDPTGLNAALALAVTHLSRNANAGMLVIPADLPHVSIEAVAQLVDLLDAPRSVALVAAADDGGTNMLACRPANLIPPSFGPLSFVRHMQAAQRVGIAPRVFVAPTLGQDIDRPEDLATFLSLGTRTRTDTFLSTLRIVNRLNAGASVSL
jgi:2-phospho-L-lactate guanylyltransferase